MVIETRSSFFGKSININEEGPLEIVNMLRYHVNAVAANVDLVPSATYIIKGPLSTLVADLPRVKRISLIILLSCKNSFAGDNKTDGAQNIQVNINGGAWTTIAVLPDDSIPCGQNGVNDVKIVARIDDVLTFTNLATDTIGVRWALAKADSDGFDVAATVLAKILWDV